MRTFGYPAILFTIMALLYNCSGGNVKEKAVIARLDEAVVSFADAGDGERCHILKEYGRPLKDYISIMGNGTDDLAGAIDTLAKSAAYKVFYPDVVARFVVADSIGRELGRFKKRLDNELPDVPLPEFYGVISPYRQSVMVTDSAVFIALNHYLGSDYPGYEGMELYRRVLKVPERIPFDVAEAVVAVRYPYHPSDDETVLSRMLYEGALLNAVEVLVGNGDCQSLIFGWDETQKEWAERNEANMWNMLVSRGLLYSTVQMDFDRLFSPSPATAVLSLDAPGRMGRFLGYRIVKSYRRVNDGAGLDYLLSAKFYNDPRSLINASYSPGG